MNTDEKKNIPKNKAAQKKLKRLEFGDCGFLTNDNERGLGYKHRVFKEHHTEYNIRVEMCNGETPVKYTVSTVMNGSPMGNDFS